MRTFMRAFLCEFYSENTEQEIELPQSKHWLVEICNTLVKYALYSSISSVVYNICEIFLKIHYPATVHTKSLIRGL
jgi:hypothetical protein